MDTFVSTESKPSVKSVMAKDIIEINLQLDGKFEDAFPDKLIPSNCYLDKSKTGLGMTYSEFLANRNSIIVIPYTSIIELKIKSHKEQKPFKVTEEVKEEAIAEYLSSGQENLKIVTTPEGFKKIIDAASGIEKLDWLYNSFFCLLDEGHCYATEAFREYILMPFEYFWTFTNKAIGTATYYPYSDPRFNQLQLYKIRYNKPFGKVTIVEHNKPHEVLHHFLTNPDMFPGNVHIFFNSLKAIEKVLRNLDRDNVNIYCREDEDNMKILKDASICFKFEPRAEEYKKFNIYTSRYNDGWDLFDNDKCTIVLITDVKIRHSLAGIPYNGFQAIGRLRKVAPENIYHITNTFGVPDEKVRSFEHIKNNWFYQATNHVQYYNAFKENAKRDGMEEKHITQRLASPFCRFGFQNRQRAEIDPMKVDQHVCAEYSSEGYSNIKTITTHWQTMNYVTSTLTYDLAPLRIKNQSQSDINKQAIALRKEYREHPESYLFDKSKRTFAKLTNDYHLLFDAIDILGEEEIIRLGYDNQNIKEKLVEYNNQLVLSKVKAKALEVFKTCVPYTNEQMTSIISSIYFEVGYKGTNGERKKGKASQIEKLKIFKIVKTQIDDPIGRKSLKTGKILRIGVWIFHELPVVDSEDYK